MARTTYAIRAHVYRGQQGWHIGSRGPRWIFPISIHVADRAVAERIRDSYRAFEDGHITRDELDWLTDEAMR